MHYDRRNLKCLSPKQDRSPGREGSSRQEAELHRIIPPEKSPKLTRMELQLWASE